MASDFLNIVKVTAAAVGMVLDSLDDAHCLLEARNHRGDHNFLAPVLRDRQLQQLLKIYDRIRSANFASSFSRSTFRLPPADACSRHRDALGALKVRDQSTLLVHCTSRARQMYLYLTFRCWKFPKIWLTLLSSEKSFLSITSGPYCR